MKLTCYFLLALALSNAAAAQTIPATKPNPSPDIAAIAKDLSSDDFAVRDAAQKRLDQIPAAQMSDLQKLAAAATDPEVKARLTTRIALIDDQLALNPPPISIHVHGATLGETASALALATGVHFNIDSGSNNQNGDFTLACDDTPFWEVLLQLSKQQPITYQPFNIGVIIQPQRESLFLKSVIAGPLLIAPTSLRTNPPPAKPATEPQTLNLNLVIVGDPRLHLFSEDVLLKDIQDENGNSLAVRSSFANSLGGGPFSADDFLRGNYWSWQLTLALPATHGKSLASIKGIVYLREGQQKSVVIVDQPDKHLNEPFAVGAGIVTIRDFSTDSQHGLVKVDAALQRPPGSPPPPNGILGAAPTANDYAVFGAIIDAHGQELHPFVLQSDYNINHRVSPSLHAVEPYKLSLTAFGKTDTIAIPFEIKDIPIP